MPTNLNLAPLITLLSTEIHPNQLATLIDDVTFEYVVFNLRRPKETCDNVEDKIIWLRRLKEVLKEVKA